MYQGGSRAKEEYILLCCDLGPRRHSSRKSRHGAIGVTPQGVCSDVQDRVVGIPFTLDGCWLVCGGVVWHESIVPFTGKVVAKHTAVSRDSCEESASGKKSGDLHRDRL